MVDRHDFQADGPGIVGSDICTVCGKEREDHEPREWLIRKDGYYYRPNCSGYTTSKFEAGRYTKSEAEREAAVESWHMKAIHQDDVEDDPVSSRVRMDTARIAELEAEVERLKLESKAERLVLKALKEKAEIERDEALSRTGAVKVKPLEWTRGWMNAEAQTEIGQYIITYRRDGSFEWGIGILKGWASSWDEAKSAAQADYERRILSALEPAADHIADAGKMVEPAAPEGEPVTLTYKNWRGEVAERTIIPKRVWFGSTDWHPEPQWLVTALDVEKQADRDFALKDFGATRPAEQAVTEEWREIKQHVQPRIADGYTAVAISKPGYWLVKGPGPAATLKAAMEAGRHD